MKKLFDFAKDLNSATSAKVYLVGGAVRDMIIGRESKDYDLEVFGITPSELEGFLLTTYGYKLNSDAKFPVYRVLLGNEDVEIGFPRRENKTGTKHSDYEVSIDANMSVEDAARRRDFTINAVYYDLINKCFVDPFDGIHDILCQLLKPVDYLTFKEDALRIFRAFQFTARFDYDAGDTLVAINDDMIRELSDLSPTSIYGEIKKAIHKGKYFETFLDAISESACRIPIFTFVDDLKNTKQNDDYHAEGDVWQHTRLVVCEIMQTAPDDKKELFFFSALFHDLGKIKTATIGKHGKPTFYNHENEANEMIDEISAKMGLPHKLIKQVKLLVKHHMLTSKYKDKKLHRIAEELQKQKLCFDDLLELISADSNSAWKFNTDLQKESMLDIARLRINIARLGINERPVSPFVNGNDVLDLSQGQIKGKKLGDLLAEVKTLQFAGRINNRSSAVDFLQKRINNLLAIEK